MQATRSAAGSRGSGSTVAACLVCACLGCAGPPVAPTAAPAPSEVGGAPSWVMVELEDFSVASPGQLTASSAEVPTPFGVLSSETWAHDRASPASPARGEEDPERRYVVARLDVPAHLAQVIDRSDSAWSQRWGELLGVQEPSLLSQTHTAKSGEVVGLHYDVRFGTRGAAVREFWVGDSLFLVAVVGAAPPLREWSPYAPFADANSARFLDSFRLHPGWRTVRLDPTSALQVPRASREVHSRSGDTTLLQFLMGRDELCRVFDTASGGSTADLELSRRTLRKTLMSGVVVVRDQEIQQRGRPGNEWLIERKTGQSELVRLFVSPGHIYLISAAAEGDGRPSPPALRCLDSFR